MTLLLDRPAAPAIPDYALDTDVPTLAELAAYSKLSMTTHHMRTHGDAWHRGNAENLAWSERDLQMHPNAHVEWSAPARSALYSAELYVDGVMVRASRNMQGDDPDWCRVVEATLAFGASEAGKLPLAPTL